MFSVRCKNAIEKALKLMEEECPIYNTGKLVGNSTDSKNFWKLRLANRVNEQFDVLFLNNQHHYIACETLFKGTIDSAAIYPRVVIQKVIEHNAAAIILAHNHPSGISTPSEADNLITKKLKEACELIDVKVLDHVIVGSSMFSYAENNLIG